MPYFLNLVLHYLILSYLIYPYLISSYLSLSYLIFLIFCLPAGFWCWDDFKYPRGYPHVWQRESPKAITWSFHKSNQNVSLRQHSITNDKSASCAPALLGFICPGLRTRHPNSRESISTTGDICQWCFALLSVVGIVEPRTQALP